MRRNSTSHRSVRQRGSALLICTLGIAVISLASIAMLRSNQRGITRLDAIRNASQSRHLTEGLLQRSIATLVANPTFVGDLPLPRSAPTGTRVVVTPVSANATRIQVYLYDGATIPAADRVVDPTTL